MDDWQLLQLHLSGDRAAMEDLIRRHINLVYGTATRLVPRADADDITQAVFLLLTQKAPHISPRQSIVGWLHQATRLCSANLRKQEGRRRRHHEEAAMQSPPAVTDLPAGSSDGLELLDQALERLRDPERAAVLLRFLEHKSFEEAGAALGISADASRKRAERGLEKLRAFFAARGHTIPATAFPPSLAAPPAPAATLQQALGIAQGLPIPAKVAFLAKQTAFPLAAAPKAALLLACAAALTTAFALPFLLFHGTASPPLAIAPAGPAAPADPGLPRIELHASGGKNPSEADVKSFLKARLDRLANLSVNYTSTTQYLPPPTGWPKPLPPPDGTLADPTQLFAGPAVLFLPDPITGQLPTRMFNVAPNATLIFPSGTVENAKSLSLLNGRARYQRTITRKSRTAFYPDWFREFHSLTWIAHDDTVDRLFLYEDNSVGFFGFNHVSGLLPEPDIESALMLAGYPAFQLPGPIDKVTRIFSLGDIDNFSVSFPDDMHIRLARDLAPPDGRGGPPRALPPATTSRPDGGSLHMGDIVHEEWTLDRAHAWAPVSYRRSQLELMEMTLSDFHEVAGLMLPQKAATRHSFLLGGAPVPWRTDTLAIQDLSIQDKDNTPELYALQSPTGQPPQPPDAHVSVPMLDISIGAESIHWGSLAPQNTSPIASSSIPAPKLTPWWFTAHQSFVERSKQGNIDVLFLGDELLEDLSKQQPLWKDRFEPLKAANFALRVDRVENLHWRTAHGELEGLSPKVIVLLIGSVDAAQLPPAPRGLFFSPARPDPSSSSLTTVTMGPLFSAAVSFAPPRVDSPEDIAAGVSELLHTLQLNCPSAKILLLSIPPQGANPTDVKTIAIRQRIVSLNEKIRALAQADPQSLRFLDLSKDSLHPDGTLSPEDFTGGYLPTPKTYQRWTDALLPILREMTASPATK